MNKYKFLSSNSPIIDIWLFLVIFFISGWLIKSLKSLFGFPIVPLPNSSVRLRIWKKNIDKILFIFEDFKLVKKNKFKDKKIDIDEKREISIISIKLN